MGVLQAVQDEYSSSCWVGEVVQAVLGSRTLLTKLSIYYQVHGPAMFSKAIGLDCSRCSQLGLFQVLTMT